MFAKPSPTAVVADNERLMREQIVGRLKEAWIRKPIKELIDELDPGEFWQIHRATVVRVDAVAQVSRNFRGNRVVHVKGRDDKLEVSRSFNHLIKQM